MDLDEVLKKYQDASLGESIGPVSRSLADRKIIAAAADQTQKPDAATLRLKTAYDKDGMLWANAYSNREEFHLAYPNGGGLAEMQFRELLKVVEKDERFGGIYINSSSENKYPIPRVMFEDLHEGLGTP